MTIINQLELLPICDYDFLSDCPSLMHGIIIRNVQHCQAMLECGVYELAYSFFHCRIIKECKQNHAQCFEVQWAMSITGKCAFIQGIYMTSIVYTQFQNYTIIINNPGLVTN